MPRLTNEHSLSEVVRRTFDSARAAQCVRAMLVTTGDRQFALSQLKEVAATDVPLRHYTPAQRREFDRERAAWRPVGGESDNRLNLLRAARDASRNEAAIFVFEEMLPALADRQRADLRLELADQLAEHSAPALLIFLEPPGAQEHLPGIVRDQILCFQVPYPRRNDLIGVAGRETKAAGGDQIGITPQAAIERLPRDALGSQQGMLLAEATAQAAAGQCHCESGRNLGLLAYMQIRISHDRIRPQSASTAFAVRPIDPAAPGAKIAALKQADLAGVRHWWFLLVRVDHLASPRARTRAQPSGVSLRIRCGGQCLGGEFAGDGAVIDRNLPSIEALSLIAASARGPVILSIRDQYAPDYLICASDQQLVCRLSAIEIERVFARAREVGVRLTGEPPN